MIKIRIEKDTDQTAIYEVNRLAFGQEDEPILVNNLRKSESYVNGLSLVAEKEGEVIGHILFTKLSIEPHQEDFDALSLAPIAVKPRISKTRNWFNSCY